MYTELSDTSSLSERVSAIIRQELVGVIGMLQSNDRETKNKGTLIADLLSFSPMSAFSTSGDMQESVFDLIPAQQNIVINFVTNVAMRWSTELRTLLSGDHYEFFVGALEANVEAIIVSTTMPSGYKERVDRKKTKDIITITMYLLASEYRSLLIDIEANNGGNKAEPTN